MSTNNDDEQQQTQPPVVEQQQKDVKIENIEIMDDQENVGVNTIQTDTIVQFTRVKTDNEKIEEAEDRIALDKFDTEAWTVSREEKTSLFIIFSHTHV